MCISPWESYFQNKHFKIFSDSQVGVQIKNKMRTVYKDVVKNIWLMVKCSTCDWCWKCDSRLWIKKSYKDAQRNAKSCNISKDNNAPKIWTRSWLLCIKVKYIAT